MALHNQPSSTRPLSVDELCAREFPLVPDLVYLNHAAVAPWPQRTCDAVTAFAVENTSQGALHYPTWIQTEQELRLQAAQLLAANVEDIAFTKNTSEGLSIVAHGFPWQAGDNVVIPGGEFPSNRVVWQSLASLGVETREIDLSRVDDPEAALAQAMDRNTRLLSVSSVQFATGLRLNLLRLGEICASRGVAFCVDAIQGLGAVQHDVSAMKIDFLAADAHKWLLGPEGIALFYCRPEWRDRLALRQFGWHMLEHASDFDRRDWAPAGSARRFEPGSPNMLGINALKASFSLLLEVGLNTVEQRVMERARYLLERLKTLSHIELVTPQRHGTFAGIVTFRVPTRHPGKLFAALQARNVVCAQRAGGIRFSPHFYTTLAALDEAVDRTRDAIAARQA